MIKIRKVAFGQMKDDEFCEMHQKLASYSKCITHTDVAPAAGEYRQNVKTLDLNLKCGFVCTGPHGAFSTCVNSFTKLVHLCEERSETDRGCYAFIENANCEIGMYKARQYARKVA